MNALKNKISGMSLKWKLFFYLLGFSGLLLLILWLSQVVFLDAFYRRVKVAEVKGTSNLIFANIASENLAELISQAATANDMCIEVINESGRSHFSSHTRNDCLVHTMTTFDKLKVLAKTQQQGGELLESHTQERYQAPLLMNHGFLSFFPILEKTTQESLLYSRMIAFDSGQRAALLISTPIVPIGAAANTLRIQLYFITGLMVILSSILAYFLSKKIATPIEKINKEAKELAHGRFSLPEQPGDYQEIHELSRTLTQASSELAKVDQLRRDLIANISHDLRTPLTLISGYAEAMRDLPGEMTRENSQIIIEETQRLSELVQDALDLSLLQSGTQTLQLSTFSLTDLLSGLILRVQSMVKSKGYEISFQFDRNIILTADKNKISQALYNLLINALQHTGKNRRVNVWQVSSETEIRVEIADWGEGIAQEDLPYIWDRYYKRETTMGQPSQGTGLGLSIVKSIIELHQGSYGVTQPRDQGTVFWITLPLASASK